MGLGVCLVPHHHRYTTTTTATTTAGSGPGFRFRDRFSPKINSINTSHEFYRWLTPLTLSLGHLGMCRASQAVELFPPVCPEVIVRDARLEDCWEVADTHCSSFFPDYTFPIDLILRIDRFVALLSGLSIPTGSARSFLVAITNSHIAEGLYFGSEDLKVGSFEGKFSLSKGSVAGILTVDTLADFLPRKGPLRQRRTWIAYVSNVAVRESERRKGIAKRLVQKAEARARSWGCRAMALHCDAANAAAMRLYIGQGFRRVKVPEHAEWPQPKASPDVKFNFMMKVLGPNNATK